MHALSTNPNGQYNLYTNNVQPNGSDVTEFDFNYNTFTKCGKLQTNEDLNLIVWNMPMETVF